ncbi:MAG TPA: helix-turn-helix transcriptional regulator [Candidatus Limivivens intestinipullorum]|uniref:Helix-turn-helix transcriptional regulator n=1 Tax=Candidatus Limivivens intestinipullorum TaxID=2840858 RepID=A0A9D1EV66_9FIRM|nr:helix-turn-helix transcriptional regulator [Candidatus Limivivens intestinipullorum]
MPRRKEISFENKDFYYRMALNITYYRRKAGLTQEKLAEKADISRSFLSAIEAPNMIKVFSLEVLFNISRALEIEPSQLLEKNH